MILLSKNCEWSNHAGRLAKIVFGENFYWFKGDVGCAWPVLPYFEDGIIISFLSPWILKPTSLLDSKLAINFHPGTSNYPGIGCYNFAIHEGAAEYGATCHHMEPKVDTGRIIKQTKFPTTGNETVEELKFRTMCAMLQLFHQIIVRIKYEMELSEDSEQWQRPAFTRKQLNQLYADFPNTRATIYPDPL
jgi:hypothetical protein